MELFENIQKKIVIDFLVKKIEFSLRSENGYSKVDKDSLSVLLEICGYEYVSKRGLDLFVKKDSKKQIIVSDAMIGRYETDVTDVVLRKSPTLKEMISFKNARKILGDSDVLKSVKKETLDYLRASYITKIDFSGIAKDQILKEAKILFEADDFEGFFKLILVLFELASLQYIPLLSKKYTNFIFGKKISKENDSFFYSIGLLDKNKKKFLFTKKEIKEKKLMEIFSGEEEKTVFAEGLEALEEIGEKVKNLDKYLPFEHNLFLYGLPEKFNLN